ncbi:ly6/PLAUR domain-containing protein 1-like isoform X2 [Lepisosteus oculatus]|uniref:ly6/PLAUR domain-containing protein 1-like isoform X2 n=1 Tax=Lepisosteus oculatus TaxID=7918 RepID=UPI0035F515E9
MLNIVFRGTGQYLLMELLRKCAFYCFVQLCADVSSLQMQCYHCEEYLLENDCSAPQFIVNCTANIQNACQKEILVGTNGVSYRKACASFSTCLIVSAGYQSFCSPGRVGSVCISCCNTPLCNGPRPPRISSAPAPCPSALALLASLLPGLLGPPL